MEFDEKCVNWRTKFLLIRSYWGVADWLTWSFLVARVFCLPLNQFHRVIPPEGNIVEVGCGHGIVAQYIARLSMGRTVIGYDPDWRRIPIAQSAAKTLPNVTYHEGCFEAGLHEGLSAVVVVGLCCLLEEESCKRILSAARLSLQPNGVLILSDVLEDKNDWRYAFSIWREGWFSRMEFTKGEGVFIRSPATWEKWIRDAGFDHIESFPAPVPMHAVFNWVCS